MATAHLTALQPNTQTVVATGAGTLTSCNLGPQQPPTYQGDPDVGLDVFDGASLAVKQFITTLGPGNLLSNQNPLASPLAFVNGLVCQVHPGSTATIAWSQ